MANQDQLHKEVAELTGLARRLSERHLYSQAAELLLVAQRLDPKNRAVRLSLADLRQRQRLASGRRPKSLREAIEEQFRRDGIDGSHFLGLAYMYADKGENGQALRLLDVAEAKNSTSAGVPKLRGKILFRRKDFAEAAKQFEQALRFNPFDRLTAEMLGRSCYEIREFESALRATVHAFLTVHEGDRESSDRLRRRIRTLKQILGWGSRELVQVFHDRQAELHTAFDRLEWHRERFIEQEGVLRDGLFRTTEAEVERGDGRIEMASRLRRFPILGHLSDEQLFMLTRVAREVFVPEGESILEEGAAGRDIYLLEEGQVGIRRSTPYGVFTLGKIEAGQLFGEASFVSGGARSGAGIALQVSRLLRFDAAQLEEMIGHQPDLGVQVYWSIWHGLARKLRATNEQLREVFSADQQSENFVAVRKRRQGIADRALAGGVPGISVEESDKVRVFREKGLSGSELHTLTTFSRERRFAAGTYIFQEGDRGSEMYVIVSGRARISKYIPGGGEEALAILGRGDFFGEMALIDGQPRSADAQAHSGELTVLALDEATVHEVLTMDADASLQFLHLLCRLITHRLREIDEKVVGWRILSGSPSEESLQDPAAGIGQSIETETGSTPLVFNGSKTRNLDP